jgi:acyl-CoA thioesterase
MSHPNSIHGQLPERLGFKIVAVQDNEAHAVLEVDPELMRVGATVHGGVLFTVADAVAANLALHSFAPHSGSTTDASIRFLRPVTGGQVEARARILDAGNRTRLIEVKLTDDDGDLVAIYQANFLRL